jgi:hypothetical protein
VLYWFSFYFKSLGICRGFFFSAPPYPSLWLGVLLELIQIKSCNGVERMEYLQRLDTVKEERAAVATERDTANARVAPSATRCAYSANLLTTSTESPTM